MRTEDLECFVELVRCKNMTVAQEVLRLGQPAISERMKRLKAEFGQDLYTHGSDGAITLTDTGKRVHQYAQDVITLTHELEHERTAPPRVRLGLNETAAQLWIGECLTSLRREFPQLALDLKIGTTNELGTMIRDGSLDLAIGTRGFEGKRISVQQLKPLALVFVGERPSSEKRVYSLAELAARGLISFQAGSDPYNELCALLRAEALPNIRVDAISSIEVMLQLAAAGGGIASLPELIAKRIENARIAILPCKAALNPLQLWLSWRDRSERRPDDIVRRAVDQVRAFLAQAYA